MDILTLLYDSLLIIGLILLAVGTFFFFVPGWLVRWNSIGNTWIGSPVENREVGWTRRLIAADYAIFSNHRITGGVMWGLSSLFLAIYIFYG
ncbi:MAG: hypothetical protein V2A61_08435 [Calditrichota bacterium]